ncbi:MAG: outer membrane lipoprotein-sorting protein [Acidimicrobiia bacterium]|nr:outer membrane lipoprotein-sorting protein [Acidimicrobiia bacterium]
MNRVALAVLLCASAGLTQEVRGIIEEVQRRTRSNSQRYEGTLEVMDSRRRITTKRWQYERIGSFGESKTVLRFIEPPEVKGVALLVHNHKERSSDQWMWTPALQRDRRIALQDRSTRFFGTDFSFEDLEERDVDHYDYKLLGEERLDGAMCWKIESRPRGSKTSQYTHSHAWVRKDIYVFAKVEGFRDAALVRRILYRGYEQVMGIWTAKELEVYDARRESRTVMRLEKLEYNLPLKEEDFTLQALRRGP